MKQSNLGNWKCLFLYFIIIIIIIIIITVLFLTGYLSLKSLLLFSLLEFLIRSENMRIKKDRTSSSASCSWLSSAEDTEENDAEEHVYMR